ncbi:hypothetical protein [Methylobacterium sp. Leaf118]|uniref:hypothetical protein n=1 Tax=Methylobacterium sp. Leaf118 TaxID=2876562 RepID=UPI001E4D9416|nr:hypothetical protein [Methylobacterium sp. Leaf118]
MTTRFLLAAVLTAALTAPAAAQTPSQTGTGGGAGSTVTAPNTSAVGRTMPPTGGGGVERIDRSESRSIGRETAVERKNDKIDTGICIGCDK